MSEPPRISYSETEKDLDDVTVYPGYKNANENVSGQALQTFSLYK